MHSTYVDTFMYGHILLVGLFSFAYPIPVLPKVCICDLCSCYSSWSCTWNPFSVLMCCFLPLRVLCPYTCSEYPRSTVLEICAKYCPIAGPTVLVLCQMFGLLGTVSVGGGSLWVGCTVSSQISFHSPACHIRGLVCPGTCISMLPMTIMLVGSRFDQGHCLFVLCSGYLVQLHGWRIRHWTATLVCKAVLL